MGAFGTSPVYVTNVVRFWYESGVRDVYCVEFFRRQVYVTYIVCA